MLGRRRRETAERGSVPSCVCSLLSLDAVGGGLRPRGESQLCTDLCVCVPTNEPLRHTSPVFAPCCGQLGRASAVVHESFAAVSSHGIKVRGKVGGAAGGKPWRLQQHSLALRGALRRRGCACATAAAAAAAAATAAIAVGYGAVVRLLSGSYVEAASGRRRRRCWAATSTGERRRRKRRRVRVAPVCMFSKYWKDWIQCVVVVL